MAIGIMLSAGCGTEIGDSCQFSAECSPTGDRVCAAGEGLPNGYCTIFGCDHDTCPGNSVCVRFYAVSTTNVFCNPETEDDTTDDCAPQEACTLNGSCVPRSAETRYCMRKCSNDGDCRDGYQCRNYALMLQYGGEVVQAPASESDDMQPFCAAAPLPEEETEEAAPASWIHRPMSPDDPTVPNTPMVSFR